MATVTGEAALLLDALGRRQGDSRILEAIALVGPGMEVEEFGFGGVRSTYLVFRPSGTDLLFEDGVLVSAMVRTRPDGQDPGYGRYPRPAALIDGLSPTATRSGVAALLGTPERAGAAFDRYPANGRHLHFEFDPGGRIGRVTALLEPV
ncbi:hypothetical protein O4J56_03855 [Nocardiopsis sp. RSe5-2]|uniref:Uncharacterized protein n=1 Tax=Nocardiopsis endophytica TaxID=3018445 RepID=A0ABT4TZW1_9ACTN|nr:hypothetical protein [Nocardiopsis endophytica]MDA2809765.1 hypothetical protein [Nocardiopsis endophytica]